MMHRRNPKVAALVWLGALAWLGAPAAPAWAQDTRTVEASGDVAADSEAARVHAIDIALAEAVGQVVIDTVAPRARKLHRAELNLQVVRRARRFVAGFKVLEEGESEGRYKVRIQARVDLAKMRVALADLGIGEDSAKAPTSEPRPELVVLVLESAGEAVEATFGERASSNGAAARALESGLGGAGFTLRSAAGQAVPISRELPEGVPLSDDAAAEMARARGAGGAWVMSVRAEPRGAIRGTPLWGAMARATVRVLDVDRDDVSLVARVALESAGFGKTPDEAMAQAVARVADKSMAALAGALAAYWPVMVAAAGDDTLLVEVRGYRGWRQVSALLDGIAASRGIERAWPRELGVGGLVLAVRTGLEARRVATIIQRLDLEPARVSVETVDQGGLLVTFERQNEVAP